MKKLIKKETIGSYKFFIKYDTNKKYFQVYCDKGEQKPYNGNICFDMLDSLYFYHCLCREMIEEIYSGNNPKEYEIAK